MSVDYSDTLTGRVKRFLDSNFARIIGFGFILILLGATLLSGELAAMFGIWGATSVLVGLFGMLLFYFFYRPRE